MRTTKESILERLLDATNGTAAQLYTQEELNEFCTFYESIWDENTDADLIAEAFVEDKWNSNKPCRRCDVCGNLMNKGYVDDALYYYCSDDCLHEDFTPEEWLEECENNDDSYYTEWYV